jgi:PAS domain S-box-containing protein
MERLFGYSAEALAGQSVETLLPERYRQEHAGHRRKFFQAPAIRPMGTGMELFVGSKDGREIPVEISLSPIEMDGEVSVIASVRDISERAEAERQRQAATRNEMLLREMHHRVKNNLQVVSSLLGVRLGSVSDPAALEIISESQRRIQSIGLIHNKFYGTKDVGVIDFGEFLNDLCSHLTDAFGTSVRGVRLELDVQNTPLGLDAAIPCGLIVTELITNALKHAFPAARAGKVIVKLYTLDGLQHLEVSDDGVGAPANFDGNGGMRGLQLITFLTQQLGGTLTRIGQAHGTAFHLSFGEVKYRKRA